MEFTHPGLDNVNDMHTYTGTHTHTHAHTVFCHDTMHVLMMLSAVISKLMLGFMDRAFRIIMLSRVMCNFVMRMYTSLCMSACECVCMSACVCVCVCVCVGVHAHVCVCV